MQASVWKSIADYIEQDFHPTYLLLISVVLILFFGLFRMWKYRVAWYFSVSLPGAFILPVVNIVEIVSNWPLDAETSRGLWAWTAGALTLCPASWLFPIILAVQIRKLKKRELRVMTDVSDWTVAGLALLYVEFDLMFAIARSEQY